MSDRPESDGTSFDGTALLERELTRLRDDVSERAQLPDFAIVETGAVRRRRTRVAAAASVLAAAVVVTAIVLAPGLDPVQEPTPAPGNDKPSRVETGTVPKAVHDLVRDTRAGRFAVAGGLDGSIAVIWRNLVQPEPTFALVTRTADGVVTGQLIDTPFNLTAVPGGWVGTSAARHYLVRPDGAVLDLPVRDGAVEPAAGDVVVPDLPGYAVYRDGSLHRPRADLRADVATYVTADGALVTQAGPREVVSSTGGRVTLFESTAAISLVGNGTHVTAIALGDDPDGPIPVVGAAVSSDSGQTWQVVDLPADFGESTSAAVTAEGTTVLTAYEQPTRFISSDGRLWSPPKPLLFEQVAAAGEVIYGWSAKGVFVSRDADLDEAWVQVDDDAGYI